MPEPQRKEDVKRLLGIVQLLNQYMTRSTTADAPLRELEKADVLFHWNHLQKESFERRSF